MARNFAKDDMKNVVRVKKKNCTVQIPEKSYSTRLAQAQKEKGEIEEKMKSEPEQSIMLQDFQAIDKDDFVSVERSSQDKARKGPVAVATEAIDTGNTQSYSTQLAHAQKEKGEIEKMKSEPEQSIMLQDFHAQDKAKKGRLAVATEAEDTGNTQEPRFVSSPDQYQLSDHLDTNQCKGYKDVHKPALKTPPLKVKEDFKAPTVNELEEIVNMFKGESWHLLAMMMSTNRNQDMIELQGMTAKTKVMFYFLYVREDLKKNIVSPFDVNLKELVTRIMHLLAADVHWPCLVNILKEKCDDDAMLSKCFQMCPDFITFWYAISMPHFDCGLDSEKKFDKIQQKSNDDYQKVLIELSLLKQDIIKIDNDVNLSKNDKENQKFCHFLIKLELVNYAKSVGFDNYLKKFSLFSKMNFDMDKLKSYSIKVGIFTDIRKKKAVAHNCNMYVLENRYFFGENVTSENGSQGSLGWAFKTHQSVSSVTSSHVMADEKLFTDMNNMKNRMIDLKIPCKIGRGIDTHVTSGLYSELVEIVLAKLLDVVPVASESNGRIPQPQLQNAPVNICTGQDLLQSNAFVAGDISDPDNTINKHFGSLESDTSVKSGNDPDVDEANVLYPMGHKYSQWISHGFPSVLHFNGAWKMVSELEIGSTVYMLGQSSGLTKGTIGKKNVKFECDYPSAGKELFLGKLKHFFKFNNPPKISLENQYVMNWESFIFPSSEEGDSGGPVFQINTDTGELVAIGILTGNDKLNNVSYVTPIEFILKAIGPEHKFCEFVLRLKKHQF